MNGTIENVWWFAIIIIIPLALIILTHFAAANQVVKDFNNRKLFSITHKLDINPVSSNKLVCPHCNKENPEDHRYCGFCGSSLDKSSMEKRNG
jgi:hypothetical protein